MSRAAVGLLSVAVLLAVLAPAALAGRDGASPSAACTWKKHSKRVTKKVRRHGKVRRVKRTKRWWTCVPVAPASPAPPAPTPDPPPKEEEPDPGIPRLGVKAEEWTYTLSRSTLPAGESIVELQNLGEDPHNLNLELEDSESEDPFQIPVTGPLEHKSDRFTLPAGTYRLWCDLPEHDGKGMHATLEVGS